MNAHKDICSQRMEEFTVFSLSGNWKGKEKGQLFYQAVS